jgi:PAS domain S-box-containing protein
LAALTRDLASSFRAAIDRAGLELTIDTPPLSGPIYVDREMWEKIVLNLISNAFKFTFEGSIRVALREAGDRVELDVADTGIGIAEHELPRLFERFHRIEGARSRSFEGSGIGLALVNELARMHGGTIRVASRWGDGTTFTIALPRGSGHLPQDRVRGERVLASTALGAAPYVEEALHWLPGTTEPEAVLQDASSVSIDAARPRAVDARRGCVVIVDDNADMRTYLARILGQQWNVRTFDDGAQALQGIRVALPDAVVTDVMMPNLDGFGLLRALRADPRTSDVPIVMLSARAGESARIEGATSGADDYVVKPFSARELVARVGAQIDLARIRGIATAERARLNELFMHAPVGIAIVEGPRHVYALANPSYCRIAGRCAEQLLGRPGREAMPELVSQGIWDLFDRMFATGERYEGGTLPATLDRGRSGRSEPAYINWVGQPVRGSGGEVASIVIFAVEITDQVVARERAERLASELQHAGRAKDEFLAMLGHELRNPLAPIVTALQVMDLRGVAGAQRERAVIKRQIGHLTRLVDDLLDVSRVTSGKVQLSLSRIEVAEVVARAIEVASPLLEQRGQHLTVSVPRCGLPVIVDPTRLAQVFSNLLTNASKYTDAGGHVWVTARPEDEHAVVEVRDSGIGIDPEMLPRVFDLFAQEAQSLERARGGLGLGLAIVSSLVKMHGGSVTAESEGRGKGAVFTVRLPRSELADSLTAPESAPPLQAAQRIDARRVLIVDDNNEAAELLADVLSSVGHMTRVAHDGPAALAILTEFAPDVALLDIGLPVMDGYELARRMRATPLGASARIYALTGYGQESDRRRSREAGFDAHLVKPVDLNTVVRAVEHERVSREGV